MPRGGSRRTKKRVKGGVDILRRGRGQGRSQDRNTQRRDEAARRNEAAAVPINRGRKAQEEEAAAAAASEAAASTQAAEQAVSEHLATIQNEVDAQMIAATNEAAAASDIVPEGVPTMQRVDAEPEVHPADATAAAAADNTAAASHPPIMEKLEKRTLKVKPHCLSQVGNDCTVCARGYVPDPKGRAGHRDCVPAWGSREAAAAAGKTDMEHCVTHHLDDCTTCERGYVPVGVPGHRRCEPKRVAVDPASPMEHCVANVGNDCTICEIGYAPAGPNFNRRCVKVGQLWDGKRMNQEHRRGFMGWGGASRRRARPLSRGRRSRRAQKPRRG
jgi:hypothetical protein